MIDDAQATDESPSTSASIQSGLIAPVSFKRMSGNVTVTVLS